MEQRLIDANALLDRIATMYAYVSGGIDHKSKKQFDTTVSDFIYLVNDAPTVETTDDVMARLPKNFRYTFETKSDTYEAWTRDSDSERTLKLGYGKTPLEAVTRLEASLNPK